MAASTTRGRVCVWSSKAITRPLATKLGKQSSSGLRDLPPKAASRTSGCDRLSVSANDPVRLSLGGAHSSARALAANTSDAKACARVARDTSRPARGSCSRARSRSRRALTRGRPTSTKRSVPQNGSAGRNTGQARENLFVTLRTVETHLTHVSRKLEVSGREELGSGVDSRAAWAELSMRFHRRARSRPTRSCTSWLGARPSSSRSMRRRRSCTSSASATSPCASSASISSR